MIATSMKPSIYDIDYDEFAIEFQKLEQSRYRSDQLWHGLYQQLIDNPDQLTTLPEMIRSFLKDRYRFNSLEAVDHLISSDGETKKTLFRVPGGEKIETVLMGYKARQTLCISTQAGCAMGCVFCATGQMGFRRHLTSGEIIEQVLYFERILRGQSNKLTNIVLMGMGEPLHNYDETMAAIDRINHPKGFNFSQRRITISTVGLVPVIRRFAAEHRQVNLAVSLHAADDELRTTMLPVNRRYPIDELISACRDYVRITNRRITFEWALIQGVNDSLEQAKKLAAKLKGLLCHVNVIPLNPTRNYPGKPTPSLQAKAFQVELQKMGIPCTVRLRRGIDIQAGCGQLATQS